MITDRADKVLMELNLCDSRNQAATLIKNQKVIYKNKLVTKASQVLEVSDLDDIQVLENLLFVSRAGEKLFAACNKFSFSLEGKIIADIGASTGGFTECCLNQGASKVFAIDVGHNQLAKKLLADERVINLEGINAKFPLPLEDLVDVVVSDLSFISLTKVLENMMDILVEDGDMVCLIKPQFEVGKNNIGKNGLVKSDKLRIEALFNVIDFSRELGLSLVDVMRSPLKGKQGNQEFLVWFKNSKDVESLSAQEVLKKI